jgi:hypothetical protein
MSKYDDVSTAERIDFRTTYEGGVCTVKVSFHFLTFSFGTTSKQHAQYYSPSLISMSLDP